MRLKFMLLSTFLMLFSKVAHLTFADDKDQLITIAEKMLGTPHKSSDDAGYDCSGFVQYCYQEIGLQLPRSSKSQYQKGKKIDKSDVSVGDIIVFTGSNLAAKSPGHVGIIHHIAQDTLYFIHSSSSQGIVINHSFQPYYKKRYLGIVRYD